MKIVHYQEVTEEEVSYEGAKGSFIRLLIGPDDGAKNFVMRRFRIISGGCTPFHSHDWEHEVFVLAGAGELMTADGPRPLRTDDVVFVSAGEEHQFRNTGQADLEFLCVVPVVN